MTNVTQEDREAAASGYFAWLSGNPVIPTRMRAGEADDHSMVQAFARHREQARADDGWQPIATAPKDGTCLLLWLDSRNPRDTPYIEQVCDGEHVSEACLGFWDEEPGCWRAAIIGAPTHWMPLPSGPDGAGRGE